MGNGKSRSFPGDSVVKHLPAVQETQVQSLGWKDPLEKEMLTHSSILAWEISWTEEPGGVQSMGSRKSRTIRVVSSAYLRLLIFLPAILIPACVSSSPAFLI